MKNAKKIFKEYQDFNASALKKDPEASLLYKSLKNGTREYTKVHRTENTAADISWVDKIEDAVNHISTIIANPRSFIKSVEYLVPAELAKKTGPESVVHLATHSQYVKSIEKNGDVIPSKVLTSEGEMDVQIYENRFIMCLIKRLRQYIEKRYIYLKHFAQLSDIDVFYLNNTFKVGDMTVNTTSTITLSTPAEAVSRLKEKVADSLSRVEEMRKYISYFMVSDFMKVQMKGARPIVPPIMQTNMLRSQPDYKAAYGLWNFLNEEEHVSMDFVVNEEIKALTKDEQERIDLLNYLSVIDTIDLQKMRTVRYTKEKYTSTIIPSVDDLLDLNDKFTTPYELMRTDEKYYEDQAKPIIKKVANHSKKVVNVAFKAEQEQLKELAKKKREAAALKRREEAEARKIQLEMDKKHKEEEEALRLRDEAEKIAAEKRKVSELEALRKEVKETAKEDAKELDSIADKKTDNK